MTMTADEIIGAVFGSEKSAAVSRPLYPALSAWIKSDRRFRRFAEANHSKLRRKLRQAADADARADLHFEISIARWLLTESRFEIEYEHYDARQGGPDYTIAYRVNTIFNVEARRIRVTENGASDRKLVEVLV